MIERPYTTRCKQCKWESVTLKRAEGRSLLRQHVARHHTDAMHYHITVRTVFHVHVDAKDDRTAIEEALKTLEKEDPRPAGVEVDVHLVGRSDGDDE